MIEFAQGSILDSPADVLVCPVNCSGVMGAGLARQFRERFPASAFAAYRGACRRGNLGPGGVILSAGGSVRVACVATKDRWANPSRLEWVRKGLHTLHFCLSRPAALLDDPCPVGTPPVLAIPALGCGLGGLRWEDVLPLIEAQFGEAPVRAIVYPPQKGAR